MTSGKSPASGAQLVSPHALGSSERQWMARTLNIFLATKPQTLNQTKKLKQYFINLTSAVEYINETTWRNAEQYCSAVNHRWFSQ